MFRKSLSSFCRIPHNVNLLSGGLPPACQKVGFISVSSQSLKNKRIIPVLLDEVHNKKFFHVDIPLCSLSNQEIKVYMDGITDKFMEAMELLSDAVSSKGTVYFSEDMTDAEVLIDEVLKEYENLLGLLSDEQARNVVRSIGLKMEELKAQLQLLKESVKD